MNVIHWLFNELIINFMNLIVLIFLLVFVCFNFSELIIEIIELS